MAQFSDDLVFLRGRVIASRPGADPNFVDNALNDRLRQLMDMRTFWADLLQYGILSFPDPYTTGTISLTTGSATVPGVGTSWPVSDIVSTTIPAAIDEIGFVEVTPLSMAGIDSNSMLYVDAGGTPEVVAVVEVRRTSFIAEFTRTHTAGCTLTQSSLANLQLRLNQSYPIFTVAAVVSSTSLLITLPWGGPALSTQTYAIKKMYVTLANNLKGLLAMKDEQTGFPIRLHISKEEADYRDPKRMITSGNPTFSLVDLGANAQGSMLYEMWPAPSSARQFSYAFSRQWPDMKRERDRPPHFINPSILYFGATADAKMHRMKDNDPYYDPNGAQWYESKFRDAAQAAKNADEAKCLEAMRNTWWRGMMPGNYDAQQLQVGAWDFGGDLLM